MKLNNLGDIDTDTFLREYWQQKPLLIRQAFPDFVSPLSPDELAGLALEEEIESRLVLEQGKTPWELRCGPFTEHDFQQLPKTNWTLLIQAVDQLIPEVTELLQWFRFLPDWRLDDIMVSYATTGGSVGPHFDHYDVFLLQGAGERLWQIGQPCFPKTPLLSGTDLSILQNFDQTESFTLSPGDMLYLPPQLAHWGKALDDDCITYSIGFRAPSHSEILEGVLQGQLKHLSEFERFSDTGLSPLSNPGLIPPAVIDELLHICQQSLTRENVEDWFGRYMTQPKYASNDEELIETAPMDICPRAGQLQKCPSTRFAFTPQHADSAHMYASGRKFMCSTSLAATLCMNHQYTAEKLLNCCQSDHDRKVLDTLWSEGYIEETEGDDGL